MQLSAIFNHGHCISHIFFLAITLFTMRFLANGAVIRNEIGLEKPFLRLTLLICITMKSSMYMRQFRATL